MEAQTESSNRNVEENDCEHNCEETSKKNWYEHESRKIFERRLNGFTTIIDKCRNREDRLKARIMMTRVTLIDRVKDMWFNTELYTGEDVEKRIDNIYSRVSNTLNIDVVGYLRNVEREIRTHYYPTPDCEHYNEMISDLIDDIKEETVLFSTEEIVTLSCTLRDIRRAFYDLEYKLEEIMFWLKEHEDYIDLYYSDDEADNRKTPPNPEYERMLSNGYVPYLDNFDLYISHYGVV